MIIYGDKVSGNCYKIKLLAALLDTEHQWIDIDILANETKTADFLAKNPNAQVPVLELKDGRTLAESNAILHYLAIGTPYLPTERFALAKVLQWQFFEQYSHEPYVAVARFINKYLGLPAEKKAEYEAKQTGGHKALQVMENHLTKTAYFVGDNLTIADISLYAYTHVAHEGGFDLSTYSAIQTWIQRIQAHPKYVEMG